MSANTILSDQNLINQLASAIGGSGSFTDVTVTGDLTLEGQVNSTAALNWDMLDNSATSLSFDTTGKTGILNLDTTNGSEGVTMSGTLGVTGLSTFTAGCSTPASTSAGYLYTGIVASTGPSNTVTLNSKVGRVGFTLQSCASNSTLTLTVNNNVAGSSGLVSVQCATNTVSSNPIVQSVVWTANTNIVVVMYNAGTASTGSVTWVVDFISFN